MDKITNDHVIAWLRQQLHVKDLSLSNLANRGTLPRRLLRRVFDPTNPDVPSLTVRQTLALADALGSDPADLIKDVNLLSEQGYAHLDYCEAHSEAPLGDLWQNAQDLSEEERTILLEYVLHQRQRRWQAG
jgi:hypothetical protein